jgi:hypothetical protein
MAKGQKRSNREPKKPKTPKKPAAGAPSSRPQFPVKATPPQGAGK